MRRDGGRTAHVMQGYRLTRCGMEIGSRWNDRPRGKRVERFVCRGGCLGTTVADEDGCCSVCGADCLIATSPEPASFYWIVVDEPSRHGAIVCARCTFSRTGEPRGRPVLPKKTVPKPILDAMHAVTQTRFESTYMKVFRDLFGRDP